MRILNSRFLLKFRHITKIIWVCLGWFSGFIIFYFSFQLIGKNDTLGFIMSLFASLICGSFTSVGDGTIVGFMKAIPPENIGGWSSGTGIAGISGTSIYLLFKVAGVQFDMVCVFYRRYASF